LTVRIRHVTAGQGVISRPDWTFGSCMVAVHKLYPKHEQLHLANGTVPRAHQTPSILSKFVSCSHARQAVLSTTPRTMHCTPTRLMMRSPGSHKQEYREAHGLSWLLDVRR
jgi:hypothetical protein